MPKKPQVPKDWTDAEKWAWKEIQAGLWADFNDHYGKVANPNDPKDWGDKQNDRRLSAAFLVTILTEESFRKATPYQGVRITGAYFDEEIDLQHARLERQLWLAQCWLKEKLSLLDLRVDGWLSLAGSRFGGAVELKSAVLENSNSSNDSQIEKVVDLTGAKIEGGLNLPGSIFNGRLTMNSIEVEQHLFMDDGAIFQEVDLATAKIGGQLSMVGSTFKGKLTFDTIEIGQSFFARGTIFRMDEEVDLIFATIGSNLDLSGATITAIDLTGTTIAGELRLGSAKGHKPTKWVGDSKMILRNTTVSSIQDADPDLATDSWPKNLELAGFSCRSLGGLGAAGATDMASRSSAWFIEWLKRDKSTSPQPYESFANLLRDAGYPSKANDILYAGRERAREMAWNDEGKPRERWRWFGMGILNSTIGYGLGARYFRALWWVLGLTYLGFTVLWSNLPEANRDVLTLLWASFDWLLPLVELDRAHVDLFNDHKSSFSSLVLGYFYFHKMVGYILASFLLAGLAGLTQKS